MSARRCVLVLLAAVACGPAPAPVETRTDTSSDLPHAGLSAAWRARFDEGDALFEVPFRKADGLGPLYIRQACAACHEGAARGPGTVLRLVQLEADGVTPTPGQPALPFGSVVRPFATSGAHPLFAPARADVVTRTRGGIAVMGRGWLEAVADEELSRLEQEQAQRTDGVSGRINRVRWQSEANPGSPFHAHQKGDAAFGRFGLKARQPTLDDFTADALQGDMGLTSPLRPVEVPNPDGLTDDEKPGVDVTLEQTNVIADYVRLIAIPSRATPDARGQGAFERAGCATCHVPELRTRADYPVPLLADTTAPVFTDLLLHDMGPALADGLVDGEAAGSEWRTAPLIGLRFLTVFLHDGRASDLDSAIRLHGGEGSEARASVDAYLALPEDDRAALLAFLSSL